MFPPHFLSPFSALIHFPIGSSDNDSFSNILTHSRGIGRHECYETGEYTGVGYYHKVDKRQLSTLGNNNRKGYYKSETCGAYQWEEESQVRKHTDGINVILKIIK